MHNLEVKKILLLVLLLHWYHRVTSYTRKQRLSRRVMGREIDIKDPVLEYLGILWGKSWVYDCLETRNASESVLVWYVDYWLFLKLFAN